MITVNIKQTFEKAVAKAKEEANNPEKTNDRDGVFSKYGKIFRPDNLDNLTAEDFFSLSRSDPGAIGEGKSLLLASSQPVESADSGNRISIKCSSSETLNKVHVLSSLLISSIA